MAKVVRSFDEMRYVDFLGNVKKENFLSPVMGPDSFEMETDVSVTNKYESQLIVVSFFFVESLGSGYLFSMSFVLT